MSDRFQELRRDLQAVIGGRANINIAQIENYGGETFLSEELATQMLQDAKSSFIRCKAVTRHKNITISFVQSIVHVIVPFNL